MKWYPLALGIALTLTMAATAFGQTLSMADILSGKTLPHALTMQQLQDEGGWRKVTVSGNPFGNNNRYGGDMNYYMMEQYGMTVQNDAAIFTKGQTVAIGNETFLVVYTFPQDDELQQKMMESMHGRRYNDNGEPIMDPAAFLPGALTAQSELNLSLLNMSNLGHFLKIKTFAMAEEISGREQTRTKMMAKAAEQNMSNLVNGIMNWAAEHDEVLPDLKTAEAVKKLDLPESWLSNPVTKEAYLLNVKMSGKRLEDIENPDEVVLVYEPTPAADGTRGVAYLDSHTARVKEADWPEIKKKSQIP